MTISFVGAASTAASSLSLPSHQARDLVLLGVYRDNNANATGDVDGWTQLCAAGANTNWLAVYAAFSNGSLVSGTWSNATHLAALVYRSANLIIPAPFAQTGASSAASGVTYPVIPGAPNGLSAWYAAFGGIRVNDTDIEVAPSGLTARTNVAGASTGELAAFDTNAAQDGFTPALTYSLTIGTTTAAYRSATIQLVDSGIAMPSGSAGGYVIGA